MASPLETALQSTVQQGGGVVIVGDPESEKDKEKLRKRVEQVTSGIAIDPEEVLARSEVITPEENIRRTSDPLLKFPEIRSQLETERMELGKITTGLADLFREQREAEQARFEEQRTAEQERIAQERESLQELIGGLGERIGGLREELITGAETTGRGLIERQTAQRATALQDLRGLLAEEREATFAETAPGILEQLESRGLLTSESTVGRELARERGRLERLSESELRRQALSDITAQQAQERALEAQLTGLRQAGLGFETQLGLTGLGEQLDLGQLDIGSLQQLGRGGLEAISELERAGIGAQQQLGLLGLQSQQQLGRGALERQFSLEDITREQDLAERIARIQADTAREQSLFGLGGQVVGGLLGGLL